MKKLYRAVLIVSLLAIVGTLATALSNHTFQLVAGSNFNSANQVLTGANTSLIVPLLAADSPQTAETAVSSNPVPAADNSQPSSNNQAIATVDSSAQSNQPPGADVVANSTPAAINSQTSVDVAGASGTTIFKTTSYAQIALGSANIMNNVWGAPAGEVYNSGIYQSPDKTFGWFWTRQSPLIKSGQTAVTPIYPSIRVGGTCFDRSKSAFFPIKLGDAKTLVFDVAYNYPQMPSGSYDLAYDLFLSDAAQPDSNPKMAAEIMIWIDSTVKQPSKYYQGDFTDGKNTFALYSWTMADGRAYYSFVLKSSPALTGQYQIDAKKLLDQIKLDSNWLVHGVEFGTEIYNGSGQIHLSQFGITLNGTQILK